MGRWFPGGSNRPRGLSLIDNGDEYDILPFKWLVPLTPKGPTTE